MKQVSTCLCLLAALFAVPASAQKAAVEADFAASESDFNKRAATTLMQFASFARSHKVRTREHEAYTLILEEYDPDYAQARAKLGFRKVKGEWREPPPRKREQWLDKANDKQRYDVVKKWRATALKLAEQHRERGLALIQDDAHEAAGMAHLRRAVLLDPFDREAHLALGHEEQDGYYGTEAELAFIKKMKETETAALMLARKQYEVTPVDEIPAPLAKTGYEFHGAKSDHFTIFTRGTQTNADDCAMWAERALEFFEITTGRSPRYKRMANTNMKFWGWIGFLWTASEMKHFKEVNPALGNDDQPKQMANVIWREGKHGVQVVTKLTPAGMHDYLIAHVFRYAMAGRNDPLLEGLVHAATWFLKSTCMTRFGTQPQGTVSAAETALPEGANWWLRRMRDDAIAGTDMPLNAVPRVPFWKFSNAARLKAWSFMTWLLPRYPDKWAKFVGAVPTGKIPQPQEVEDAAEKAFNRPLAEVEAEWREWASGRGIAAAATGYGPPLLPPEPSDVELEGLSRLNSLRELVCTVPYEGEKGLTTEGFPSLPACDLDAESTMACKNHAVFLGMHEEHHVWPEAHEEDPAKEGFTPSGMRAGLRSVIVFSTGGLSAARSIDSWIGTVYHRFPLLEYNINRIGLAYEDGPTAEVVVLDMGSLEEPRTPEGEKKYRWIVWPPDEMKNVPRVFAFTEHPNPLEDVGLDFDDQKDTGYPVSLQMSRTIAQNITGATMRLYVAKKRGGKFQMGDEVPCWLHTPDVPLLKRMELRDVLFVIPKAHLEANTTYLAVAELKGAVPRPISWTFTTGTHEHDLGRR